MTDFFKFIELLLPFVLHKKILHCDGSIVIFDGCWLKFLHKLARVLLSLISKNMALPLLIFNAEFVFGHCKEFTFVISQKICPLCYKYNSVNRHIYHVVNQRLMFIKLNIFSNFKFNLD